jgi:hypothetical protein
MRAEQLFYLTKTGGKLTLEIGVKVGNTKARHD